MTDIIAKKDLGNGLELRVEPSFRFDYIEETDDKGSYKFAKIEEEEGMDLSLYRNDLLCLSPQDYYCQLGNYESQVRRETENILPIFIPIIQRLAQIVPKRLVRVYEVFDADIVPFNFDLKNNDHIKLSRKINDLEQDILFFFDRKEYNPNILKNFWLREYVDEVENRFPIDKCLGNPLLIYFVESGKTDCLGPFEREIMYRGILGETTNLLKESTATIMSLSYGYRMRVIGFDEDIIKNI